MSVEQQQKQDNITKLQKAGAFWDHNLDDSGSDHMSPYMVFDTDAWSKFKADTPLTLSAKEVDHLRSLNDPVNLEEVRRIYLSLSRLLSAHVEASQSMFQQRRSFLSLGHSQTPFVIGVAGSVAVGKSTTARLLRELLQRWPSSPKVDLVTTDGFLLPNSELEKQGIMNKKGFPESYDVGAVLKFLSQIKAGKKSVKAPVYSHLTYDVKPNEFISIEQPDILIFEGINVLQSREMPKDGRAVPFVSDYFDFSIYIDADEKEIEQWYIDRFMRLRITAFTNPSSFFHKYSKVSHDEALQIAQDLWDNINLVNLHNNIKPTRPRADLVLRKGADHLIEKVALRKL
ncbi:MAG: type I pantothenate kinase [Hyphomicrobiales bacterium]|nr:type I pantothenate kinase [Hyphomicrobiales bacterium]PCH51420.1 MAG: type I pantothenate kinase [Hyphomicrobiales bacterium]